MKLYPDKKKNFKPIVRLIAGLLLPCVLTVLTPAELIPQTYRDYNDAKLEVDRYFDRAARIQDRQSWENYVDLGIAHERVEWERDAYETLMERVREIDRSDLDQETKEARTADEVAVFEAAANSWDAEATAERESELGRYLAEQEAVSVTEREAELYEAIIASTEAAVAGDPNATLADWDAAMNTDHAALVAAFETELTASLDTARANNATLTGDALAAFNDELTKIEEDIRAEFRTRDSFYITRARNRYVALLRGDDLNARLAAEEGSADAVVEQIIASTEASLSTETTDQLQAALDEAEGLTSGPGADDFETAGTNWEARMEAVIESGLRAWQTAEEDLYAKRLAWQEQTDADRETGERIWQEQYDELVGARNEWLEEVQVQIQEGRDQWQAKIAEFQEGRQQSEDELAAYIQSERERWDAASQELADIVNGGGAALLETKDAYRYYDELLTAIGPPGAQDPRDAAIYQFYQEQRDYMQGAVGRFQTILAGAEGVLQAQMHSPEDSSGLLNDVRLLAGDLPATVAGIDEGDFENDLLAEMQTRGEDFLLYRRDIEGLVERNGIFVSRAAELRDSTDFDYNSAADLTALGNLINDVDRKYDDHRVELAEIFNQDRSSLPDDAARLAAIKADIDAWVTLSTDSNKRLKQETSEYFNVGLGGYYLTGNEGDPYLMTRAEYEWELLRRERNYLTKKLRRAEEVKRYADLAFQHEAGLEMAAVTTERADTAKVKRDLTEISYLLIKGDPALNLDPNVYTDPAVRDAELTRLLAERGIDTTALDAREATLAQETGALDDLLGLGGSPTVAEVEALVADFDAYLEATFPDSLADFTTARGEHPLGLTRAKLIEYRDLVAGGADASVIADRWTTISGGATGLRNELQLLADDYDFAGMRADIETLRDRIDDENLTQIRGDLDQVKQQIEANATLLADAKVELDLAKDAYRQARIDFDVIRAGNSQDLIRLDLLNTTAMLSSVTHRMANIEDIDGFNGLYGAADEQRIRYLNEISQRERATGDLNDSQAAFEVVQGLEEARKRGRELETLITGAGGAAGMAGKSATGLADLFIGVKANVLATGAAESYLNSTGTAADAFASIEFARGELDRLTTELTDAITGGDPTTIAIARAALSRMEESVFRNAEVFTAAVRGEEQARLDALYYFLESTDGEGDPLADPTALTEAVTGGGEALREEAFALSESAAERLNNFLSTNADNGSGGYRTFAELLELANTAIAGLGRNMELDNGYGQQNALDDRARSEWNIVRNWLLNNQTAIEYANETPDEYDPRSVADKWESLLESAANIADDADAYNDYAAGVPTDASDAWVVNFVNDRNSLKTNIETVLAASDAGLAAAYAGLTATEKETIYNYTGPVDPADARLLHNALEHAARAAGLEAAAAPENYKAYYNAEQGRFLTKRLGEIETELADEGPRLSALEAEKSEHEQYKTYLEGLADPTKAGQIADLAARIAEIETRIATLEPGVTALETEYRQKAALAREAAGRGSSVPLLNEALNELYLSETGRQMQATAIALMQGERAPRAESENGTAIDRVKAIIGFYETTETGEIRKDGSGTPIVSQEFIDAGIADPAADLSTLLAGDQRGDDLAKWAERLSEAAADESKASQLSPEVLAAIDGLETAIRSYLTATELINRRYDTTATIKADATDNKATSEGRLDKLVQIAGLENDLRAAIENAVNTGGDPVDAALVVLEAPDAARKLQLFQGYDANGEPDGITDPAAAEKTGELIRLASRLRQARLDRRVLEVAAQYAGMQSDYASLVSIDRGVLPPDQQAFRDALIELNATTTRDAVTAIAVDPDPANIKQTRDDLWAWVAAATPEERYYRGTVIEILTTSTGEGQALKDEITAALDAQEVTINDTLSVHFEENERQAARDGELQVTTSVTNLISAYAARATTAKTTLQPAIDAIPGTTALADAQTQIRAELDTLTDENSGENQSALHPIRRDMIELINAATDTVQLKSTITTYLTGLNDPAAADVTQLQNELYVTTLQNAIGTLSLTTEYDPDHYPEELRELTLVREYQNAEKIYAEYQRQKASANTEESAGASLNLTGIHGPIATSIMVRDFTDWQASTDSTTTLIATRRAGGEGVALADYLAGYYEERNTALGLLPGGGAEIAERVMKTEYARLQNDITTNGIAAVNENDYFDDLREYILIQKAAHYFAANGTTLTGATLTERSDNLQPTFEAFLNDAGYNVGGKTLGQRVIGKAERERYFAIAFAYLEESPPITDYLPASLTYAVDQGTLTDPLKAETDYLPAELTAITDYATADYRAMATAIGPETEAALTRIEVNIEAAGEDWSLTKTDAELADLIERAGYPTLPPGVMSAIIAMLKTRNAYAVSGSASTAEEAAMVLRQNRVLSYIYPTEADEQAAEEFLAAEAERITSIEEKFFKALGERHSDLREAAKEDRGTFLRALIEHERGTDTAYYNALSPELKTEIDLLHGELFTTELTAEEKTALLSKAADYQNVFDLRSGQELVASGIFESTEATIVIAVQRLGSEAARTLLNDHGNRANLLRAFIETVQLNAGQRGALSPVAQGLLTANPELADIVTRAADEMETSQKDLLEREQVLIDRFYANFTETAEERREIGKVLDDLATLNPDATLSMTYEINRELAILNRNEAELTAALTNAVDDHQRYFAQMQKDEERKAARANELLKFAIFRGDDYQTSRFSNYRTYIGAERQYQEDNLPDYQNNGGTLETTSLGVADVETMFTGDWQAMLTSDGTGTFQTVTNDDGDPIEIRAVKSVSSATLRYTGNDATAQAAEMRKTYFENLANNYLEATSQLNAALNAVWVGAQMTDTREAEAGVDIKQTVRDNYDPDITTAQDLTAIQNLKIDAQSRLASHSATQINEYANGIASALEQQAEQGEGFAGAGRRKQIAGMSLTAYLENRFNAVAAQMNAAEATHTALSNNADTLRNQFAARNRDLADGLETMAEYWREYEYRNDEYEERAYVQEYAETPYLFASAADASDTENSDLIAEYRGDAKEEYERALAAVNDAQNRLQQKGYEVQIQDDLDEFNAIVTGLDAGTTYLPLDVTAAERLLELRDKKYNDYETLSAAEEAELTELSRREMYSRYRDVIDTQKEHIKQTMRMTRIHKASEIVNAEIMRLRAVADEKQKQFEQELNSNFGAMGGGHSSYATVPGTSATAQMAARDGVYLRLANLVEGGGSFWQELRGWYWKSQDWQATAGDDFISSTASTPGGLLPTYTMNQIIEGAMGHNDANNINATDRAMIGGWMKAGGTIAEFSQFQGVYYGALMAIGVRDQKFLKNEIIKGIYLPIRANGQAMNRIPFCRGCGNPLINAANSKLIPAEMEYMISEIIRWYMYSKARSTAGSGSTQRVMAKQREYEDALAKLYYFTRIPDLQTFKQRLIDYGTSNPDDPNDGSGAALYQVLEDVTENGQTVDDLIYMRDSIDGYVKADGTTYTPDADTIADTLDVTGELQDADYRDPLGRRYDPNTIRDNPGGPLEGGVYRAADGNYTRIKIAHPNGTTEHKFARLLDESADKEKVYDMGEVLEVLVDHGQQIRDREHADYVNAHETAATTINDRSFLLNEKDQTYEYLFNQAAGHEMGGREFTGYRMTYQDYNSNSAEVYTAELTQRQQVQQTEWALREQELVDRYHSWEARVATILERGRKSWAGTEDRFLAKWRQWRRDFDEKEEEGRKAWDDKIQEHFTAKEKWENDTRLNASEATIERVLVEAVTDMNSQLLASAQSLGVDIETIDMMAAINEAKAELQQSMPSGLEKLKNINKNINNFSTKLSIAEMTGGNFLNGALNVGGQFRSSLKEHQHRMKILTNVKIFEQYRTMSRKFEASIDDQNAAVDAMTESSAVQAGFVRSGNTFVKQGGNDAKGVVHAYKWFDVRGALIDEKRKAGFDEKTGNDLVSFLEDRNETEVEAYFYTQKLTLQAAIERIQGKPGATGTNPDEIGLFNAWKGAAGNSAMRQAATRAAGNSTGGVGGTDNRDQVIDIVNAGFGELGARSKRPGGAPLGFYPELEYAAKWIDKREAEASPGADNPLAVTLKNFSGIGLLEYYENVEVGSKVYGRDRGKLINAQATHATKNVGKVAGQVAVAVGTLIATAGNIVAPGVAVGVGVGIALAGSALIAASNATQVDVKTGDTLFKLTDQAALQSVIEIGVGVASGLTAGAMAGIGSALSAGATQTVGSAMAAAAPASAVYGTVGQAAQAGFKFNEQGQSQGWGTNNIDKQEWHSMGVGLATAAATSYAGGLVGNMGTLGGAVMNDAISNTVAWAGRQIDPTASNYNDRVGPQAGFGGYTGLIGGQMANSAIGAVQQWSVDRTNMNRAQKALAQRHANRANETEQQRKQLDIINGIGYSIEERKAALIELAALDQAIAENNAAQGWVRRDVARNRAAYARQQAVRKGSKAKKIEASANLDYESRIRDINQGALYKILPKWMQNGLKQAAFDEFLSDDALAKRASDYETRKKNTWDTASLKSGSTINYRGVKTLVKAYDAKNGMIYLQGQDGSYHQLKVENGLIDGYDRNSQQVTTGPITQGGQALLAERQIIDPARAQVAAMHRGMFANDIPGSGWSDVLQSETARIMEPAQAEFNAAVSRIYMRDRLSVGDSVMAGLTRFASHYDFGLSGAIYQGINAMTMGWAQQSAYRRKFQGEQNRLGKQIDPLAYGGMALGGGWISGTFRGMRLATGKIARGAANIYRKATTFTELESAMDISRFASKSSQLLAKSQRGMHVARSLNMSEQAAMKAAREEMSNEFAQSNIDAADFNAAFTRSERVDWGGINDAVLMKSRSALRSSNADGFLPSTGVGRYDALVVGTKQYSRWKSNVQRRGFKVMDEVSFQPGTAAEIENHVIKIDPTQFRYVDMLHESRHFGQIERAAAQGIGIQNKRILSIFERGAYEYERRLGEKVGFSDDYMNWAKERIWGNKGYWSPKVQKEFRFSEKFRSQFQSLWR